MRPSRRSEPIGSGSTTQCATSSPPTGSGRSRRRRSGSALLPVLLGRFCTGAGAAGTDLRRPDRLDADELHLVVRGVNPYPGLPSPEAIGHTADDGREHRVNMRMRASPTLPGRIQASSSAPSRPATNLLVPGCLQNGEVTQLLFAASSPDILIARADRERSGRGCAATLRRCSIRPGRRCGRSVSGEVRRSRPGRRGRQSL